MSELSEFMEEFGAGRGDAWEEKPRLTGLILPGFTNVSMLLGPGIYALVLRDKVVYIGKAKRLNARIYAHRNLWERKEKGMAIAHKAIEFTSAFVMPCRQADLSKMEVMMINRFKPQHNERLKTAAKITLAEAGFRLENITKGLLALDPPIETLRRRI